MRPGLFLLPIFLLIVFTPTTWAITVHIPDDFATIQAALDSCASGDTVIVRDGTYTGDGNRDIDFLGKAIVLMTENGPEMTIIDCQGSPGDSHQGLNFNREENTASVVRGFTIKNGNRMRDGCVLHMNSSPIAINESGSSSADMHRGFYFHSNEESSSVVQGFTITNGYHMRGGGIYCYNSSPTIIGNIITNNSTREAMNGNGGGIYCYGSSPVITDNVISGNSAYEAGGGICCTDNSNPTITGNTITGNTSSATDWAGGGIYSYLSSPSIEENTISENIAEYAGGIYCHTSTPSIKRNTISGNIGNVTGGGLGMVYSDADIIGNTITGNVAANYGGGIALNYGTHRVNQNLFTNNVADSTGGAMDIWRASVTMWNNTFSENSSGGGGGFAITDDCDVTATNMILQNNDATSGEEIWIGYWNTSLPSTLTISYSDVEGGQDSVFVDTGCTLNWGDGMIDTDPLFRDPSADDFHLMAIACGDSLDSPCIDAGDPARLDSLLDCSWGLGIDRSDMGAYGGYRIPEGIGDQKRGTAIPRSLSLSQNYPNPFNPSTTIAFDLPVMGSNQSVNLTIYDLRGRCVRTLIDSELEPGNHKIHWNGIDDRGQSVASGIYLYRLKTGDETFTRKMTVLK